MQRWKSFPRFFLLAVLLIGLLAGISAPAFVSQNAKAAPLQQALALDVIINEIGWAGTQSNSNAEWIELYNPGANNIDLTGWTLGALDTNPNITLSGTINAGGYYLLERTADTTISDIPADFIYAGALSNTVENLELRDNTTALVDTANQGGLTWFAGSVTGFYSMERKYVVADSISAWGSNNGTRNGLDSGGLPINGTPKQINSATLALTATPTFTPSPGEVVISEIAWSGTLATPNDEWIELFNTRSTPIDLTDWRLVSNSGSVDIVLSGSIPGNGFFLLERAREITVSDVTANQIYTGSLSDSTDGLSLSKPNGTIIDTANSDGGSWPAGSASPNFYSMERVINSNIASPDNSSGWLTNNQASTWTKHDAANNLIHGTPGNPNWAISITLTPSNTPTPTITFTPSVTPTITGTRPTPTRTGTATRTATPNPPLLTVIINEVAWMGTIASTSDEWIELYNPGSVAIDLTGWVLRADDESPFITWNSLDLTNVFIQPGQYYLLERTDDTTVTSFTANKIYSNALDDSPGDVLKLFDAQGRLIDTANSNGGDWPAGGATSTFRRSMERTTPIIQDGVASWATFAGTDSGARDANNGVINGTPGFKNWVSNITLTPSRTPTATSRFPTPRPRTATPTPFGGPVPVGRPFINEFLPRPGFDWNLDGKVDTFDEFIELKNVGNADMNLSGWRLDDSADFPGALSSAPYTITDLILKPGEYAVFYASQTNILLSDGGDSVRLFDASGDIMDVIDFTIAKVEDESVCRLPDGNGFGSWFNDCTPTPNLTNSRDGQVPTLPEDNSATPFCALPDTLPADFLFAECRGYGANIWDNFYWDEFGWMGDQIVPENKNKWKSFIE